MADLSNNENVLGFDQLAVEIGMAVHNAQRTATDIVLDAQERADNLVRSASRGSVAKRRDSGVERQRLQAMLNDLDRVEAELSDRQAELIAILDGYLARHSESSSGH